jgi:ABC-type multidrug transport system ATPase subunit
MPCGMLVLEGVGKTYGPVRALSGVSLTISRASVTVVMGANGSGKSTLLALLGMLTKPTSGRIDHGQFGRTRTEVRRRLGWLGHETLCYPDLTGIQNIEFAARLYGCDPAAAVSRARARFDLGTFVERPLRTYSRGQRQRVALARALVNAPTLLLLDEPASGLDGESSARLEAVVREEASHGALVVVASHDGGLAERMGATVVTLDRGRLREPSAYS